MAKLFCWEFKGKTHRCGHMMGVRMCQTTAFPGVLVLSQKWGGGGRGPKCGFPGENADWCGQVALKRCQKVAKRIGFGRVLIETKRIRSQKRPEVATAR